MTRRILLILDQFATDVECGECLLLTSVRADDGIHVEWMCTAFPVPDMAYTTEAPRRVSECLAAERAARELEVPK